MISINTNLSSLIVQSNLKNSTVGLNNAIQRMTSGFKINGAKDNAAGYSISTSLSTKIGAYQIAEDNVSMGLDMVQTASNSLSQMSDLTSRLRSLAVQASNGTYGNSSLDSINSEAQAIVKELHRIQNTTSYNGITLLNGGTKTNSATSPIAVLAASAQTTSSPKAGASGFIEEVQRRDTSAMTTLASVDENTTISSGTYSISTAEELAKLATMTNSGRITGNAEFVLANDIDTFLYRNDSILPIRGNWTPIGNNIHPFTGTFDGNGYVLRNLYQTEAVSSYSGLFGSCKNAMIQNVACEDADITGAGNVAIICGIAKNSSFYNCYVKGAVNGKGYTGGIVGFGTTSSLDSCYAIGKVTMSNAGSYIGGLAGSANSIENSFAKVDVVGNILVGGLAGSCDLINNSYTIGSVVGVSYVGAIAGQLKTGANKVYYASDISGTLSSVGENKADSCDIIGMKKEELEKLINKGFFDKDYVNPIYLQIGINSSASDVLELVLPFIDISSLDGLSMSNKNAVDTIDEVLKSINEQQTNYGSAENRLTSALEQISVAYDNLVSSRSTIRDADIAQESSNYIKMQILQQASATLLATANQNPSIALQLI